MGKGAFVKTENGWMIDTKVKVNGEWKHFVKRGYPTLSAAKADFDTAKEQFLKNKKVHHEKMFFEELFDEYFEYRKLKINESTWYVEKKQDITHISNYFKDKLLNKVITKNEITNWYKDLLNRDIKDIIKNRIISDMKAILKYAYDKRYIDADTYQDCDTSIFRIANNDEKTKKIIWTAEEENRFFNAVKDNEIDYLMFRLFFLMATRLSEFLGLQVKCLDLEKNQVKIFQQLKYNERRTVSKKLKSEQSYRVILITKELSNELQKYIDTFNLKDDDFLFFTRTSTKQAISLITFRTRLYKYCDIANVPKIVPHGVRHAMAVKLAKGCETTQDIEICASRLGHTPSVFMDIYANHTKVEEQEKLMKKILGI